MSFVLAPEYLIYINIICYFRERIKDQVQFLFFLLIDGFKNTLGIKFFEYFYYCIQLYNSLIKEALLVLCLSQNSNEKKRVDGHFAKIS